MSKVTLPLSLLENRNVSSSKELKKRNAQKRKAQPELSEAVAVRDKVELWCEAAMKYDNELADHAPHIRGMVVVDNETVSTKGSDVRLSGDLQTDESGNDTAQAKAKLWLDAEDGRSALGYRKSGDKETYTEKFNGKQTRLVLDHARGTLTFEQTNP